jgi:hypothetical protein
VDNRTGFRPDGAPERRGGPAFYAAEARRALGIEHDLWALTTSVPVPVFSTAVGIGVAAGAFLARPQRLGYPGGIGVDVVLAVLVGVAIVVQGRQALPGRRWGVRAGLLPAAALLALALVLAGSDDRVVDVLAAAVAAAVIAATPILVDDGGASRARRWSWRRLVHDAAAVAVATPVAVAAASGHLGAAAGPALAGVALGALALATATLPAADLCLVPSSISHGPDGGAGHLGHARREGWWRAPLAAAGVALVTAILAVPASSVGQGRGGAVILLGWYGVRGGLGALLHDPRRASAIAEHAVFVAVAIALLLVAH